MKFKCIKAFSVEKYDEDGFCICGKYQNIPEGSLWQIDTDKSRVIGGTVRLVRVWKTKKAKTVQWLEISNDALYKHFDIAS